MDDASSVGGRCLARPMSTLTHTGSHPVLGCVDTIGDGARRGRWRGAGVHDHRAETDRARRAHQADLADGVPQAAGPRRRRRHRRRDRRPVHRRLAGRHHPRPPRCRASICSAGGRGRRPLPARRRCSGRGPGQRGPSPRHRRRARGPAQRPRPRPADQGERHLVEQAAQFGPRELRRLGDRLLEAIAPDIADQAEYERLVAEERRAHAATKLAFQPRGDGSTDLFARIPDHVANRLRTYLDAFTSPRRAALDTTLGEVDHLPVARRRGEAFCALLENLPEAGLPRHGGTATSVMVTLDHDTLVSGAGIADTTTGDRITAGHASLSEPANTRNSTPGRDRPPTPRAGAAGRKRAWPRRPPTVASHVDAARPTRRPSPAAPARGGGQRTRPKPRAAELHHHRAHDPAWSVHHHPNGTTTFTRRT